MKTLRVQVTEQSYKALMSCVPNYGTSPSEIITGLIECFCDPTAAKIQFDVKPEIRDKLISQTLARTADVLKQIEANSISAVEMVKV